MAHARPKQGKNKADCNGDRRGQPWVGIPQVVLKSEAYRTLTAFERSVLIEILARMTGYNNGSVAISYVELAHRMNRRNQAKFAGTIDTLWKHGLIEPGMLMPWKERMAREYRLTFVNTVVNGKFVPATNEYLSWMPSKQNVATNAVAGQPKTVTPYVAERIKAATKVVAAGDAKLLKTLIEPATDAVVLIDKPYPLPEMEDDNTEINSENQPDSAAADLCAKATFGDPVEAIRQTTAKAWHSVNSSCRNEIIRRHDLTLAEMKAYLDGSGHISFGKQMALRSTALSMVR